MVHGQNVSVQNLSAQNISATKHVGDKTYRRQIISMTKSIAGQNVSLDKTYRRQNVSAGLKKVINKIQTFLDKYSIKSLEIVLLKMHQLPWIMSVKLGQVSISVFMSMCVSVSVPMSGFVSLSLSVSMSMSLSVTVT
jgi:hypothetical protein